MGLGGGLLVANGGCHAGDGHGKEEEERGEEVEGDASSLYSMSA